MVKKNILTQALSAISQVILNGFVKKQPNTKPNKLKLI